MNDYKKTNKFEWENYSKGQNKRVLSGDKERVNIAFSEFVKEKKFWFEGNNFIDIPDKPRFGIEIIVSVKIKGIRKDFPVSGYLVHETYGITENPLTSRFYIEERVSNP